MHYIATCIDNMLHVWLKILGINRTRDKIARAYTHTQRHMNNAWSKMVSCSPHLFFFFFLKKKIVFLGSYKQFGITLIPLRTSNVVLIFFHASSMTFLSTTNNLMLYILNSYFASSQRLLNPFPLLMLDAYPLQVSWLALSISYPPLDNTSNISLDFLVSP